MSNNINFVFFNMSIEWQISDFNQKQMNDLKYFFDDTINIAIEIVFVEQSRIFERTINEIINVCFNFLFAFFAFSLSKRWNSISHEQKQFTIVSIFVVEQIFFHFCQNDFAKFVSFATISFFSRTRFRFIVVSFFRFWFRSTLKFAFIARFATYDCFLFFYCVSFVIFFNALCVFYIATLWNKNSINKRRKNNKCWKYRTFCYTNRFDFSIDLKSSRWFIKIENFEFAIFASKHERENVSINFFLFCFQVSFRSFFRSFFDFFAFVDIFSELFTVNSHR